MCVIGMLVAKNRLGTSHLIKRVGLDPFDNCVLSCHAQFLRYHARFLSQNSVRFDISSRITTNRPKFLQIG